MKPKELINQTSLKIRQEPDKAKQILKEFHKVAFDEGYKTAQNEVSDWITAEQVERLYLEQQ